MYSEQTKRFIKFRLALIKYSGCAAFYWNLNSDKLIPSGYYTYLIWCQCYYGGILLLPFFYYHLYTYATDVDQNQNEMDTTELVYKGLAACFMVVINTLVTWCSLIVSILKTRKGEICAFYNGCFGMDSKLKSDYTTNNGALELLQSCIQSGGSFEHVVRFAVGMSLIPPFVMTCMMFHRIDALHVILEEYFELQVEFTPRYILIALVYGWACFAMCNTFMTYIFPIVLTSISSTMWTRSTKPTVKVSNTHFETKSLGVMSMDRMISIYRNNQLLCCYTNGFIAMFRFSLHLAMLHILFIVCSYLIIQHFGTFYEMGVMELIGVLFMFIIIAVMICKIECMLAGAVVDTSDEFKRSFLKLLGRKHYAYKVALSFQRLSVNTTYPLFTVSNDTFLEFLNVSVDHIVNLICI